MALRHRRQLDAHRPLTPVEQLSPRHAQRRHGSLARLGEASHLRYRPMPAVICIM